MILHIAFVEACTCCMRTFSRLPTPTPPQEDFDYPATAEDSDDQKDADYAPGSNVSRLGGGRSPVYPSSTDRAPLLFTPRRRSALPRMQLARSLPARGRRPGAARLT